MGDRPRLDCTFEVNVEVGVGSHGVLQGQFNRRILVILDDELLRAAIVFTVGGLDDSAWWDSAREYVVCLVAFRVV